MPITVDDLTVTEQGTEDGMRVYALTHAPSGLMVRCGVRMDVPPEMAEKGFAHMRASAARRIGWVIDAGGRTTADATAIEAAHEKRARRRYRNRLRAARAA